MSKPPRHIGAVLSALRLNGGRAEELGSLDDATWHALLAYTDSTHLTLYLAARARDFAPGWVRQRLAKNLSDNSRRFERIKAAYGEMAYAFRKAGVNHVVLKGFSQWPDYSEDLRLRLQSDIDFYCPPESIFQARDLLIGLGYKEVPTNSFADHLPIMIREGGWQWKGNYYDPDIPPMVELHHRLWNRERLRFGPSSLESFWSRRQVRRVEGIDFPALHWVDNLGFSALQVLRDLVNHGLLLHKVYELARFLDRNVDNKHFWQQWIELHDGPLRQWQAIAFRLAVQYFACDVAPQVADHIKQLPGFIEKWIVHSADSFLNPLENLTKDALWLHLALIDSAREKIAVGLRVLIPMKLQTDPEMVAITDDGTVSQPAFFQRLLRRAAYGTSRLPLHARLLPVTLWHGLRLWWSAREFKAQA